MAKTGQAFACSLFSVLISFFCGSGLTWYLVDAQYQRPKTAAAPRAVSGTAEAPSLHRYPVEKVLRVVDGDTLDVRFAIWEDIVLSKRLRLLDVDTPELRPRSGTEAEREAEKEAAKAALAFVQETLGNAAGVYVVTDWESDSFGRVLASVMYEDTSGTDHDLAAELLSAGHAQPYEE